MGCIKINDLGSPIIYLVLALPCDLKILVIADLNQSINYLIKFLGNFNQSIHPDFMSPAVLAFYSGRMIYICICLFETLLMLYFIFFHKSFAFQMTHFCFYGCKFHYSSVSINTF